MLRKQSWNILKEKIIKRIIYFLKWVDEKIININLLHYLRDRPKDSRQAVAKKKENEHATSYILRYVRVESNSLRPRYNGRATILTICKETSWKSKTFPFTFGVRR